MNTQAIEQLIRDAYFTGFNQAHYSHLHPDTFPPKEINEGAEEYLKSVKTFIEPTAQPTEVYVPVSGEEEQPKKHDRYPVLLSGGDLDLAWYHPDTNEWETYLDEEITHWLKKIKAVIYEQGNC